MIKANLFLLAGLSLTALAQPEHCDPCQRGHHHHHHDHRHHHRGDVRPFNDLINPNTGGRPINVDPDRDRRWDRDCRDGPDVRPDRDREWWDRDRRDGPNVLPDRDRRHRNWGENGAVLPIDDRFRPFTPTTWCPTTYTRTTSRCTSWHTSHRHHHHHHHHRRVRPTRTTTTQTTIIVEPIIRVRCPTTAPNPPIVLPTTVTVAPAAVTVAPVVVQPVSVAPAAAVAPVNVAPVNAIVTSCPPCSTMTVTVPAAIRCNTIVVCNPLLTDCPVPTGTMTMTMGTMSASSM